MRLTLLLRTFLASLLNEWRQKWKKCSKASSHHDFLTVHRPLRFSLSLPRKNPWSTPIPRRKRIPSVKAIHGPGKTAAAPAASTSTSTVRPHGVDVRPLDDPTCVLEFEACPDEKRVVVKTPLRRRHVSPCFFCCSVRGGGKSVEARRPSRASLDLLELFSHFRSAALQSLLHGERGSGAN